MATLNKIKQRIEFQQEVIDIFLIILGALSCGFGVESFLVSSGFIDGGVTGISMLLFKLTNVPLYFLIPLINLPFVVTSYYRVGSRFAYRSAFGIAVMALVLATVHFPDVTDDKLLSAIFGGFFIGAGIGLTIRGGGVLDGTEVLALLATRNFSVLRVGDIILIINIVIFAAALFFLGVEPALYSMLAYFTAGRTLDFFVYGIEEYTAITIISHKSSVLRAHLIDKCQRGVTLYKAQTGRTLTDIDILYCVVTRLEVSKVRKIVNEVDPKAFVLVSTLSDVKGGLINRRKGH